jgi:beta,beta-carotene 9',10'-dioxygenase
MSTTDQIATTSPALGFQTSEEETVIDQLDVQGEIPAWLGGSMLRTGPAKFEIGDKQMRHWFDGLAMLHRFTVADGAVSYGSRFMESRSYRAARATGEMAYGEFATDPCRSLFKRVQTMFAGTSALPDNANINVARLGEHFIAMTEAPLAIEFDARTLQTASVQPYRSPGELTTAHPHGERGTGAMLNYAAKLGPRSSYRFYAVDPDGTKPRVLASLKTKEPSYMHSFGLSERWFVLGEYPLVVNPLALALSGRPYIENYRWKPERGTRFTLLDRQTGEVGGVFETDACFSFHHVNAYEDGDEVVVDACTYPDAGIIEDLYLERLRAGKPVRWGSLTRFRLNRATGAAGSETIAEDFELPRINYGRCNERPYRYTWGNGTGPSGWVERIVKVDVSDGTTRSWSAPGCYPSEPIFVARPDAADEDDGVLLSIVLDAAAQRSMLLVFDAADLEELARASVPHHIPFSFHGQFMRGVA